MPSADAPAPATNSPASRSRGPATNESPASVIARLRDEGTNRSQIADLFGYLTDVIGPRLTGSPNCRRANEWTRDKLTSWGLTNAQIEAWGPFGRGWSLKRFSAQVIEPQAIPLIAWPKAWSCGSERPLEGEAVYLDARTDAEFEQFKGKLKGCIVLISVPRELPVHFEPLATRLDETNLLRLANAAPPSSARPFRPRDAVRRDASTNRPARPTTTNAVAASRTNAPARTNDSRAVSETDPPRPSRGPRSSDALSRLRFAVREGAAATVSVSSAGDGGTVLVGEATVVGAADGGTNRGSPFVRPWATNAPPGPPQMVLAAEHYNRLIHLLQAGEKVRLALEVQTQFHDDLMSYNTTAEIPGTDRKQEVVMLGAHLDSMAGGTGGADNGAGVVVCLEAVRLLKALDLKPRRTIRIGLWSGEEQGLLGSKAYVARHFGYFTNRPPVTQLRSPRDASEQPARTQTSGTRRVLERQREYERCSAYYNLDNGAGRIRGIYLQGNEALRPIFRAWLEPLRELGAETITASNTGGTDHLSFDAIGLPGFQFLQDPVEYGRTYHTTMDVRERALVADLQQAAIVMAAFVYQTAMLDEKLPRKSLPEEAPSRRP